MNHWDLWCQEGPILGKRKWGKVSGPEKGKAKEESRGHCRVCVFCPHPLDLPLAQEAQAGPVSLDSFSWSRATWSPQHSKVKRGCWLFGKWCLLFLPVLSLSSRKKQRKGSGWKRHVFVMSYLKRRQSEKGAWWSKVLRMYPTLLPTHSLAGRQCHLWTSSPDAALSHTTLPRHTSFIRTYLSQMPIHRSS